MTAWADRRLMALALVVVGGLGLLVAGCSSNDTSASSTTTTTAAHSTHTGSSTTKATTAKGTTSSTAATTVATCQPSQLKLSSQTGNGAAGTITLVITMTNTSTTTCSLYGYPGMQLLDAKGTDLPTKVIRGGVETTPSSPAKKPASTVTLAPGKVAAYSLTYSDVPTGNETSCPESAKAEVTAPNDTATATMTLAISACAGGTLHVSPVYAFS